MAQEGRWRPPDPALQSHALPSAGGGILCRIRCTPSSCLVLGEPFGLAESLGLAEGLGLADGLAPCRAARMMERRPAWGRVVLRPSLIGADSTGGRGKYDGCGERIHCMMHYMCCMRPASDASASPQRTRSVTNDLPVRPSGQENHWFQTSFWTSRP
jgi:hypothetical protein